MKRDYPLHPEFDKEIKEELFNSEKWQNLSILAKELGENIIEMSFHHRHDYRFGEFYATFGSGKFTATRVELYDSPRHWRDNPFNRFEENGEEASDKQLWEALLELFNIELCSCSVYKGDYFIQILDEEILKESIDCVKRYDDFEKERKRIKRELREMNKKEKKNENPT
jgi:hypothetical protein